MDPKTWKLKLRTGGFRRKVQNAYQNIQKIKKTTACENSVNEIFNKTNSLETDKTDAPSSSSMNTSKGPVDLVFPTCDNGSVSEKENSLATDKSDAPSSSSMNTSEGPVDFVFPICDNGSVSEEECNNMDSDSDSDIEYKKNLLFLYSRCNNMDSDSDSDIEYKKNMIAAKWSYRDQIRIWALTHKCSHAALKDLFKILNQVNPNAMPKDPRSLLGTPREIAINIVDPGEYWHNNLKNIVTNTLENSKVLLGSISILVNVDGVPIYKSSKQQFWPILCSIFEMPRLSPIICGIYLGSAKPKDMDEYFKKFNEEMNSMILDGINIRQRKVSVSLRCFVCDSPARAMLKGVCNYNGKHGCLKCTVVGEYSHVSHTVIFPDTNCPLRNDKDFREKKYGNHHKFDSPLLKLPIDMIESFPVSDSLHLIDLGIVKRLMIGWRDGNFGKKVTKWHSSDIHVVNAFLNSCITPTEIHRAVRGLDCLSHWKGSEFRTFFHYLSLAILPKVLKQDVMQHFLTLFCAITICSSEEYFPLLSLAEQLLEYFTKHYKDFYGIDYLTSNVHNLTHIVAEVRRFGTLQTFNAYKFENKLYLIKNLLRQGNKPLTQIAKRLKEYEILEHEQFIDETHFNYPYVKKSTNNLVLHFNGFTLSNQRADKYFFTVKKEVMEVKSIKVVENQIYIYCKKFDNLFNAFDLPIFSSHLNIFKSNYESVVSPEYVCLPGDVKCKMVVTRFESDLYFVPLLHTL